MSRHFYDRPRTALAERSIVDALRVFARRRSLEALGQTRSHVAAVADEVLAIVDLQTVTAEPAWNAVVVHEPASMLLDTLRFDVSNEEWQPFARGVHEDEARSVLRIGAVRGGVLVALAEAEQPEGRLSQLRVLVSPAFRQIGLGHLVLHRAVNTLLREGLLPYARLVTTDLGSRALARAVGFVSVRRMSDLSGLSTV